jgi:Fic family protein
MHILQRMSFYIHQKKDWTNLKWDSEDIVNLLSEARNLQGRLYGKMEVLGFELLLSEMIEN